MSLSLKKNSLVVCTDEQAYGVCNRVGKVFAIVERKNPYDRLETMALFKLNYNGQWYIIPAVYLRKATAEEKTGQAQHQQYWKDQRRKATQSCENHVSSQKTRKHTSLLIGKKHKLKIFEENT